MKTSHGRSIGVALIALFLHGCEQNDISINSPEESPEFAARVVNPTVSFQPLPSSVFNETSNLYPAYPLNTAAFKAYVENTAKKYIQRQLNQYADGMDSDMKQYLTVAEVKSLSFDINTGEFSAQCYIRFSKNLFLNWSYGVNLNMKMQLVARPDYSDIGVKLLNVTKGTTDGLLDWTVDNSQTIIGYFSPIAQWYLKDYAFNPQKEIDKKFVPTIYWSKYQQVYGAGSHVAMDIGLSGELAHMINMLSQDGGPLSGFKNSISGTFTYNGQTVSGTINPTFYCESFNISTGVADISINPTLVLNTSAGVFKTVFKGYFRVSLSLYLRPMKDHKSSIMTKVSASFRRNANGTCSPVGVFNAYVPDNYCTIYSPIGEAYWQDPQQIFEGSSTSEWWIKANSVTIRAPGVYDLSYQQEVLNRMISRYNTAYAAKITGVGNF